MIICNLNMPTVEASALSKFNRRVFPIGLTSAVLLEGKDSSENTIASGHGGIILNNGQQIGNPLYKQA